MAEGGDFEDPFDWEDRYDDDDDDDQEVNTTQPLRPGATSTPYHGSEETEMKTRQHEQTGLPATSYEETPLLGAQAEQQNSWEVLTWIFPEASTTDLETSYSKTRRLQVKMMGFGKKLYNLFTKDSKTGKQQLNPSLPKEIKNSLGPMAQELIDQENESIRRERQNLLDAENQLKQEEKLAAEREKASQEVRELRQRNERTRAQIDAIQDEQGSNVESEAELRRLKQLKKNLQTEFEKRKKKVAELEKQAKTRKKKKQRSTGSEQASRQKKVKETPWKKG